MQSEKKITETESLMLDYSASLCCEGHTGRKWFDLDNEEKGFWRNEAKTQAQEWQSEVNHYEAKRPKKTRVSDDSPEP
ncbi:hypothetical protein RCH14_004553 [Massilia sp. MP_M2]|uniref:hypothetical protein n=1 Tax=Massilia sp. MP_M2 TaxID=3071713 RepID=UPI00319DBD80